MSGQLRIIFLFIFGIFNCLAVDLPEVTFYYPQIQVSEVGKVGIVELYLNKSVSYPVTVPIYTKSGTADSTDHDIELTSVVFDPGSSSAFFSFKAIDDQVTEGRETFKIKMGSVRNAIKGKVTEVEVFVYDDFYNIPSVNFSLSSQSVQRGSSVKVDVSLDQSSDNWTTIPYLISGTSVFGVDHNITSGELIFLPGQLESTLSINTFSLSKDLNKNIKIELQAPRGNVLLGERKVHTIEIVD